MCGQENSGEVNLEVTGTQPVIFAYGENFEAGKSFPMYHGNLNRGSKVLAILGSLNEKVELDEDTLEHADFNVDVIFGTYGDRSIKGIGFSAKESENKTGDPILVSKKLS